MLADRSAMVFWSEKIGTTPSFVARRVWADGKKGDILAFASTSGARSSGFPRATVAGNRLFVSWTDDVAGKIRFGEIKWQ